MSGEIRVIHIENEPDAASVTRYFLERESDRLVVDSASTPAAGLERIRDGAYDCVVCDYEIPAMNGIEVLEAVRADHPELPFILFTGKGSEEIASEAISAGVSDYLQKQSGTSQYALLANRIENAVDKFRSSKAVERTERRYHRLIEEANDAIMIVDEEGRFQYLSPATERVLGYRREELLGEKGFDYVHPDDLETTMELFFRMAEEPDLRPIQEFRFERPDGSWMWVEVMGRNLLDDPEIGGLVVYARDISERKQQSRELIERDRQLELAMEGAEAGVWEWDVESGELYWSEELLSTLGYSRDEFDGTIEFFEEKLHPDDAERTAEAIESALETGESYRVEQRVETPGEGYRWLDVRGQLIDDPGKQRMVGVGVEITERKEQERQLESIRERMRFALDATDSYIYEIDRATGSETRHGPFERLHNLSPEAVPTSEAYYERAVHPDDRAELERLQQEVLPGNPGEPAEIEFRTHPNLGEQRWLRSAAYVPETDTDRLIGLATDVTERKAREAELEYRKSVFEATLDTSIDAIHVVDEDRRIVAYNQQFVDMWDVPEPAIEEQSSAEALQSVLDVVERPAEFTAKIQHLYEHPEKESRDRVRLTDGRVLDRYSAPVTDADGAYYGRLWIYRDITDLVEQTRQLQRRERELRRQNARLEEFTRVVSHDLRNPLNIAMGAIESTANEHESEYLDIAERSLGRMDALIADLLNLARHGEQEDEMAAVELGALADRCWSNVETDGASIHVDTDLTIRAYPSRLQQLLENLMRNAVEHGGDDVTIKIGSMADGPGFFVADDGPGIPPEVRDRVFESGYSTNADGTGFGLGIVRDIAEAHGWEIALTESRAGGAQFEITDVDTTA